MHLHDVGGHGLIVDDVSCSSLRSKLKIDRALRRLLVIDDLRYEAGLSGDGLLRVNLLTESVVQRVFIVVHRPQRVEIMRVIHLGQAQIHFGPVLYFLLSQFKLAHLHHPEALHWLLHFERRPDRPWLFRKVRMVFVMLNGAFTSSELAIQYLLIPLDEILRLPITIEVKLANAHSTLVRYWVLRVEHL